MTLIKQIKYFLNNVPNSPFFCSSTFTSFFFDIFLFFFIILNGILNGHKFVKNRNISHFFSFDFDPILVLQKISWMDFNVFTYWLHSTVHEQLLIFEIKMDLFVSNKKLFTFKRNVAVGCEIMHEGFKIEMRCDSINMLRDGKIFDQLRCLFIG